MPRDLGTSTAVRARSLCPGIELRDSAVTKASDSCRGRSIILVEQNAMLALTLAGYGYVLETGRLVLQGPPTTSCATKAYERPTWDLIPAG